MMWWRERIDAGTVLKKQVNFLKFPKMRRSNVIIIMNLRTKYTIFLW